MTKSELETKERSESGRQSAVDAIVKCFCGAREGCSETCDRSRNPFYLAVSLARGLPPTGRQPTLDWVINKVAEWNKRKDPEVGCNCDRKYEDFEIEEAQCFMCHGLIISKNT